MRLGDWQKLLARAAEILDGVGIPPEEWTFGGGTALAYWLQHRLSRDVDIFLTDAQYLLLVTPRLNSNAARGMVDYEESSVSVKIVFPQGDVDFIVAPRLTEEPFRPEDIGGRKVLVELPVEIVLKKLFYRAEGLKVRDLVDIAAALESAWGDELVEVGSRMLARRIEVLEQRLGRLTPVYAAEVKRLALLKPHLSERALSDFEAFLKRLKARNGQTKSFDDKRTPRRLKT